jgi:hypothetical protein
MRSESPFVLVTKHNRTKLLQNKMMPWNASCSLRRYLWTYIPALSRFHFSRARQPLCQHRQLAISTPPLLKAAVNEMQYALGNQPSVISRRRMCQGNAGSASILSTEGSIEPSDVWDRVKNPTQDHNIFNLFGM